MSGRAPVEYATAPRGREAARSLAAFLGVTEARAAALLADDSAGPEIRSRRADPAFCRRQLERRYAVRQS
jgi:hypothetical protein